jgi:hypothetical protein
VVLPRRQLLELEGTQAFGRAALVVAASVVVFVLFGDVEQRQLVLDAAHRGSNTAVEGVLPAEGLSDVERRHLVLDAAHPGSNTVVEGVLPADGDPHTSAVSRRP